MKKTHLLLLVAYFMSLPLACNGEEHTVDTEKAQQSLGSSSGTPEVKEEDASAEVDRQLREAMERASARLGPILRAEKAERLSKMKEDLEGKGYSTSIEGLEDLARQKAARLPDRENALVLLLESDDPRSGAVFKEISEDESDFLRMTCVGYRLWVYRDQPSEISAVARMMEQAESFEEKFEFALKLAFAGQGEGIQYLLEALRSEALVDRVRALQGISRLAAKQKLSDGVNFFQLLEQQLLDPAPEVLREIDQILRVQGFSLEDPERVQDLLRRVEALRKKSKT